MNNYYQATKEAYTISTDPGRLQLQVIHQYLSVDSYWAKNIPYELVEQSVANSLCFGLYTGNTQIGFARVITDKTTFAYLADVFVLPDFRGKGLARWLMETVHAHPELQSLRGWLLTTTDAHNLYRQFGWEVHQHPEKIMRKSGIAHY